METMRYITRNNRKWYLAAGVGLLYVLLTSGCQQPPVRVYKVANGPGRSWEGVQTFEASAQGPNNQRGASGLSSGWKEGSDLSSDVETARTYHIGSGDVLEITIAQLLNLDRDEVLRVAVDQKGQIYLPLLNHVAVGGMTTDQVRDELTLSLGREFIRDPKVDVRIYQYASKEVMVLGVVGKNGPLQLKSDSATLMEVINQAGGITATSAPNIEIYRGAYRTAGVTNTGIRLASWPGEENSATSVRELVPVNLLYAEGSEQVNPRIYPGDVVKVPRSENGYIYLSGEVRQPGAKPYRIPLTILQAISSAGGITKIAQEQKCQILRRQPDGSEMKITVNLKKIEKGKAENITLCQNDTVILPTDPTEKFFDDVGRLFRAGFNTGVDMTYDAGYEMGFPGNGTAAAAN